jgi:DNA-binding MarR family transcriptional regulator
MPKTRPHETAPTLATFQAFMTLFGSVRQVMKSRLQDSARALGPVHLRALSLCQANPGWTQQQLGQAMGRDKGQIARLIRDLEAQAWLTRTPDAQDGRVWRLGVSVAGARACARFLAIEAEVAADLLGGLPTQEREQLQRVLESLHTRLEQLHAGEG